MSNLYPDHILTPDGRISTKEIEAMNAEPTLLSPKKKMLQLAYAELGVVHVMSDIDDIKNMVRNAQKLLREVMDDFHST